MKNETKVESKIGKKKFFYKEVKPSKLPSCAGIFPFKLLLDKDLFKRIRFFLKKNGFKM